VRQGEGKGLFPKTFPMCQATSRRGDMHRDVWGLLDAARDQRNRRPPVPAAYPAGMTLVVAHRGASAAHPPGNTLDAFRGAVTLGADWVELDVRPTADGALAVHHDAELPDGRTIAALAAAELPEWVPLLDAALDACGGLGVNVEIKADCPPATHDGLVVAVVDLLSGLGAPERFLVTSFAWELMDRVRALAPGLATGLLAFDLASGPDPVAAAVGGGHRAVNPWDPFVDETLVARAHAAGVEVNTWTVDDPARIAALAGLGVDAVITNVPDVARAVLSGG
jgi:glycerophosphoryl diester phosphodiesterase